ncbi:hypothetical protein BAZSYMB_SCAFFOLD00039_18 [Bathymodiolus azoricus thioautotrophic gill symbiont]|uniref:Uncharacterized protein n=1 Tax=Bathymodiolus azoricus thioautotrophic gill symbiont TaxID=235205 RepID=A0A1H6LVY4_9GAMM|nr:hypothetical protein BAZSYMB_SCAFFOLD00039_18 [Bathymodiolus azoricus thioautotrophic gill symbiont]
MFIKASNKVILIKLIIFFILSIPVIELKKNDRITIYFCQVGT